jgi:hypothetical protein
MSVPDHLKSLSRIKIFDSEEVRELVKNTLNACLLIPIWNKKRKGIFGHYRRQTSLSSDKEKTVREIKSKPYSPS